jgi:hypothetical protein
MGAGSTIAACVALGYEGIGIELDPAYFGIAKNAIPALASLGAEGERGVSVPTGKRGHGASKKSLARARKKVR